MRLKTLKLNNFRCYSNKTIISLGDLVVFVGKNDAGKSSILESLEIFFEEKPLPDKDDICVNADSSSIKISCCFDDLPKEIVIDEQRSTSLQQEYLLNLDGDLEIVKEYKCDGAKPKLNGVFAFCNHPSADEFSDLLSLNISELKKKAGALGVELGSTNLTVKSEVRKAIWEHATDLQLSERKVELNSQDAKDIWNKIKLQLPVFSLFRADRPSTDQDAEAQDPLKAAIKEAIQKNESVLQDITEEVTKHVQEIANRTVEKICEMNKELASELNPRVTSKKWDQLFSVSLTGDESIPINKRGSGTRRLILLNFFRAKAEQQADIDDKGVIYAIEEPETSQHPNNQRMLLNAFEEIMEKSKSQVFLTTHNPNLCRRFSQDVLRLVSKEDDRPLIRSGEEEEVVRSIVNSLGVLPDNNCKLFLGVEGRNDIDFLKTISSILALEHHEIPDLSKAEEHGKLIFIPLGGSTLNLWVSRLEKLDIPEFYLMDRDERPPKAPKYDSFAKEFNKRDNCTAWTTSKRELENYIHHDVLKNFIEGYAGTGDDFEDVPELFAKAVHEASESKTPWSEVLKDKEKLGKKTSKAKRRINTEVINKMTCDHLNEIDSSKELENWLREIGCVLND